MRASRWILAVVAVAVLVWLATRGSVNRQPPSPPLPPAAKALPASSPHQRVELPPPLPEPVTTSTVATNPPPQNAADLYREAFAILDGLSKEEKDLLGDWRTNAVAPELCAKLQPAVALAHQATTNCDWGIKFEGVDTPLPHLSKSRQLARTLLWNAAHCRQEDAAGSGADLLAALRLGQNSSEPLIGHLVNTAIQGMALDYLAENARSLPAATLAELAGLLGDESYDDSFYRGMEGEAKWVESEVNRLTASTNDVSKDLQLLTGDAGRFATLSKEQILAAMREVVALERDYVNAIGLPEADYQAWLTKLEAARQSNPMLDLMPAFDGVLERTRAMVVQRAMAVAGLQVLVSGPSVLPQHLDPATGQPFQYQPTATGFVLTSAFQNRGKPVTLNFHR